MSQLSSLEELFAGRHFDHEVIILCVRWYLRYNRLRLSRTRDLAATKAVFKRAIRQEGWSPQTNHS